MKYVFGPRRSAIRLVIGITLLVGALVAFQLWRVYTLALALRTDLRSVEALITPPLSDDWADRLCPQLAQVRGDAVALQRAATPFFPITRHLGGLANYGPNLVAAEPLLTTAVDLAAATDEAFAALSPLLRHAVPLSGASLTAHLADATPQLREFRAALERANGTIGALEHPEQLSPALSSELRRAQALLPEAIDGLDLALAAPDLLGANGPQDYLILAQNPDELRATGGFITAGGILTVEHGRVTSFTMQDSATLDNLAGSAYPLAPEPMRHYMDDVPDAPLLWQFRDANWSPDFPTAAQAAQDLYRRGQGHAPGRVVAIAPAAIQRMLAAIGPISVEKLAQPVSAASVLQGMRDAWSQEQATATVERKTFLTRLGAAMIDRIEHGDGDLVKLARALEGALDAHELLLYVPDSPAAEVLARRGWDGAVHPASDDFLMVVDSNVGYNKINPNIHREINYAVDLSDPTAPHAAVTVRHISALPEGRDCDQGQKSWVNVYPYEERMVDCYWNYLRVLTPSGSGLLNFEVTQVPGEWMLSRQGQPNRAQASLGEAGTQVYSALVVVPQGGKRETTFRYRLPPNVVVRTQNEWRYQLSIQRQPSQMDRITVQILLPPDAGLVATSTAPVSQLGQIVTFSLGAQTEPTLDIRFQGP